MPHFVVVEDDHLQRGPLEDYLALMFAGATVDSVSSEAEFRGILPRLRKNLPDLVVMDVMVRWEDARQDRTEPPDDVAEAGYYRAGLRSAWLLQEDPVLKRVPLVLYTILELGDLRRDGQELPPNASYVGKDADLDVLMRHVRSRLNASSRAPR